MSRGPRIAHLATVDLTVRFLLLNQLRRLRDEGHDVTAISAPGPWRDAIEAEGIRFVPWRHATRSWDPLADARAFAELVGILRRERFDLVHTHTPKAGILGRIAARAAGVPAIVNTVHGLYATPEDGLARRAGVLSAEQLAAGCSDLELYQSEEDLRWARRIGLVRRGQGVLLGNGCDLSRFDPARVPPERTASLRGELGIAEDALVVGTIGRLVAEKGYRELFAVARAVRWELPEARFLVVGEHEPGKADAIPPGEVAAARDDIVFAGWREDTPELLSAMDVFALPSWREGVPRSAIEAAAMGRPMVLTDIRGCREVIRDGLEGFLVPVRSPSRLAEAILRLLRDPDLRARMGPAARARAEERFDELRVLEVLLASYRRVLGAPAPVGEIGPAGDLLVRLATRADVPALVRLHRMAMPESFLPTLGQGFMRRLYRAFVDDPQAVALVADDGGRAVGMATGALTLHGFYRRFVLRHGAAAAISALPSLLRPGAVRRAREAAAYSGSHNGLPEAEFTTLAVDQSSRARGLGRRLTEALVRALQERGADGVKWYVGSDNEPANRLYERMGYELRTRIVVHGRPNNVWVAG